MSEDRNKHDHVGSKDSPLGHKVGKPKAERTSGMGQTVPERVIDEAKGKTSGKGKGSK